MSDSLGCVHHILTRLTADDYHAIITLPTHTTDVNRRCRYAFGAHDGATLFVCIYHQNLAEKLWNFLRGKALLATAFQAFFTRYGIMVCTFLLSTCLTFSYSLGMLLFNYFISHVICDCWAWLRFCFFLDPKDWKDYF